MSTYPNLSLKQHCDYSNNLNWHSNLSSFLSRPTNMFDFKQFERVSLAKKVRDFFYSKNHLIIHFNQK